MTRLHLNAPAGTSDEAAFEALKIRQDGASTAFGWTCGLAGDPLLASGHRDGMAFSNRGAFLARSLIFRESGLKSR